MSTNGDWNTIDSNQHGEMFSITGLLNGAAISAIALCLIANSASAAPKVIRDGKLTDAEYMDAEVRVSSKTKPAEVRIVPKYYVVHPQVSTSRKQGK